MAIHKRVRHRSHMMTPAALPTFSYPPSDDLATVVIDAWINGPYTYTPTVVVVPAPVPVPVPGPKTVPHLADALLQRDNSGNPTPLAIEVATYRMREAHIDLERAVVISEEEHDMDYYMQDDLEVVFVLPRPKRLHGTPVHIPNTPITPDLLATAKLLMACVPNGI